MIRQSLRIAVLISGALALAACSKDAGQFTFPPAPPITPAVDQSVVSKIQSGVTTACGFVPAASSVAEVVATFTGGSAILNIVESAVNGICNAVRAKGARRGGKGPVYRGVVIRGHRA